MNSRQSTILSTKKLTISQKELLLNSGIGFVEYDAIDIEFLDIEDVTNNNIIFTSKNAVKAVLKSNLNVLKENVNIFCVGEKTKKLLEEYGQNVIEIAQNASDLAQIIVNNYKRESFLFFCGNMRRDDLPTILEKNDINFTEKVVYNTYLRPKKLNRIFDGILFFSPSGVDSYISENTMNKSIAFCIGRTTAIQAEKYTNQIIIANKSTIENVIVQAIKKLKTE